MHAVFLSHDHARGGMCDYIGSIKEFTPEALITITLTFICNAMADAKLREEFGLGRGDYLVTVFDLHTTHRYAGFAVYEEGGQLIDIYPADNTESHWVEGNAIHPLPFHASYTNLKPKPLHVKESVA